MQCRRFLVFILMTNEKVTENWKFSEFKDVVVDMYSYYMNCYSEWMDGVQGVTASNTKTRSRFISALSTFYSDQRGFFLPYLQKRTFEIDVKDYDNLVFNRNNISDNTLYLLHLHFTTWFNTIGAKALGSEVEIYPNAIEGALAELFNQTQKTRGSQTYQDLQPIYNFLYKMMFDTDYGIKKQNQDAFFVITGATGCGKSYLLLDLFDYWYRDILKDADFSDEYIKYFATTNEQHQQGMGLLGEKKWYFMAHDEVVRAAKRRNWMRGDNKNFADMYEVIRGLNLVHGHAIPDFSDMDLVFIKRRIDFLIVITIEGKNRYANLYSRHRARELYLEIDKEKISPERAKTPPNFKCKIPEYKGILLNAYQKQKQIGMQSMIDSYSGKTLAPDLQKKMDKAERVYNLVKNKGYGLLKAYKEVGVSNNIVGKNLLNKYCELNKLEFPK